MAHSKGGGVGGSSWQCPLKSFAPDEGEHRTTPPPLKTPKQGAITDFTKSLSAPSLRPKLMTSALEAETTKVREMVPSPPGSSPEGPNLQRERRGTPPTLAPLAGRNVQTPLCQPVSLVPTPLFFPREQRGTFSCFLVELLAMG